MRTRRAPALAAVATMLATGACVTRTPLESTTSTLVVHAVLNLALDDQLVLVQRTSNGVPAQAAVDSAAVTITGPDGVAMTAVELADSALGHLYRVRFSSFGERVLAGGSYRLDVRLRGGEEVTGTTTVPSAVPAPPPASGGSVFTPSRDTLRLVWASVPGAGSYEVRVESPAASYALFADTSVVLPGNLQTLSGGNVFTSLTNNVVIVSAVDRNYYQYYHSASDEFSGAAVQGNLTGAEGVFGALVVVKTVTLYVASAVP